MNYFTIKKAFFLVSSNTCYEEFEKIEKFMSILEKSGVGKTIEKVYREEKKDKIGRNGINPFNMFAMIVYCFTKFKGSLRDMEDLYPNIYTSTNMYELEEEEWRKFLVKLCLCA